MNNHFISRSLTKLWEHGQGRLLYFDFDKESFCIGKSKRLFARTDIYSKKLEDFLSEYIESPMGKMRNRLLKGELTDRLTDWSEYRAIFLLVSTQATRFNSSIAIEGRRELESLAEKGSELANDLVSALMENNQAIQITLSEDQQLFFPEVGFFPFYVADESCVTGFSFGYAVPIHPRIFVAIVSKSASNSHLQELRSSKNLFSGLSLNTSRATRKAVMTFETLELNGENMMRDTLMKWRALTDEQISSIDTIRSNVIKMYSTVGLTLKPIRGSMGGVLNLERSDSR